MFTMVYVKARKSHLLLPAALSVGSFLCLLAVMFLTSPVKKISYAIVFFVVLLSLLLSLGYLWVSMWAGKTNTASRPRIAIISILLIVLIMFRSAGSLSWIDLLVVLILGSGLLFYSGRRSR